MRRLSTMGIRVWVFAFLLSSLQLQAEGLAEPQPISRPTATPLHGSSSSGLGDFSSANDFYYYQGKTIPLQRSPTEVVVHYHSALGENAKQQLMQALSLPDTSISPLQVTGKTVALVTIHDGQTQIASLTSSLQAQEEVEFVFPVLRTLGTNVRMLLSDEIVVKVQPGQHLQEILGLFPEVVLTVIKPVLGTTNEYVVRVHNPKVVNPLAVANTLVESGLVIWATPNFIQEYQHTETPNDPLYPNQWNLHNTGQGGGQPHADVNAPEAWDLEQGNAGVTIAIIDDGVETSHEDLAANIFTNPGEIVGNGLDDDGNGLIDDVHGWDFANNDNDPNPSSPYDTHGTAVAGVAAARGNNAVGVSGICPKCKLLPVKLANSDVAGRFAIDEATIAAAIRYAASLAAVLNGSWAGGNPSNVIRSALQDAVTVGRGGKGAIPLFAAGNLGSGFKLMGPLPLPAGAHRFQWIYTKNESDIFPTGADTAWLAWVVFPGLQWVNFESPPGWATSGQAPWSNSDDPTHADEGFCFTHAMKAGAITHNQSSSLQVVRTVPAGTITFRYWVDSEKNFDGLKLVVDLNNDGSDDLSTQLLSGQTLNNFSISYPAVYPEAIAVGASSEFDCRASYSSIGPELDFVAPGGFGMGVYTTDRTGLQGNAFGNYWSSFAGTSAATPLAAGVAALLLAHHPHLTHSQIRQLMRTTADKIGPEPYIGGRNDRYGYGRINAARALTQELPVGYLENPQPTSYQSGISLVSGWVCHANEVLVEFDGDLTFQAAYGTSREDTQSICGDSNNGFGFLWNWNILGDGTHTVRVLVDGFELGQATFTVSSPGLGEFPRGLSGSYSLPNFPFAGQTAYLRWQESLQNFVITTSTGVSPGGGSSSADATLENPQPATCQSGIGVLSGWKCNAGVVTVSFDGASPIRVAYGTSREDTQSVCGDTNNGFGLLWNWNRLGDGTHTARLYDDGIQFADVTFTVTTFGQEFLRGVSGQYPLPGFPQPGATTTVRWQESAQNFFIEGVQ